MGPSQPQSRCVSRSRGPEGTGNTGAEPKSLPSHRGGSQSHGTFWLCIYLLPLVRTRMCLRRIRGIISTGPSVERSTQHPQKTGEECSPRVMELLKSPPQPQTQAMELKRLNIGGSEGMWEGPLKPLGTASCHVPTGSQPRQRTRAPPLALPLIPGWARSARRQALPTPWNVCSTFICAEGEKTIPLGSTLALLPRNPLQASRLWFAPTFHFHRRDCE